MSFILIVFQIPYASNPRVTYCDVHLDSPSVSNLGFFWMRFVKKLLKICKVSVKAEKSGYFYGNAEKKLVE